MSRMLMELVGKRCVITDDAEEYLTGDANITCRVLAVDEEWLKVAYRDAMGNHVCRMTRVENISGVLSYEN